MAASEIDIIVAEAFRKQNEMIARREMRQVHKETGPYMQSAAGEARRVTEIFPLDVWARAIANFDTLDSDGRADLRHFSLVSRELTRITDRVLYRSVGLYRRLPQLVQFHSSLLRGRQNLTKDLQVVRIQEGDLVKTKEIITACSDLKDLELRFDLTTDATTIWPINDIRNTSPVSLSNRNLKSYIQRLNLDCGDRQWYLIGDIFKCFPRLTEVKILNFPTPFSSDEDFSCLKKITLHGEETQAQMTELFFQCRAASLFPALEEFECHVGHQHMNGILARVPGQIKPLLLHVSIFAPKMSVLPELQRFQNLEVIDFYGIRILDNNPGPLRLSKLRRVDMSKVDMQWDQLLKFGKNLEHCRLLDAVTRKSDRLLRQARKHVTETVPLCSPKDLQKAAKRRMVEMLKEAHGPNFWYDKTPVGPRISILSSESESD